MNIKVRLDIHLHLCATALLQSSCSRDASVIRLASSLWYQQLLWLFARTPQGSIPSESLSFL